VEENPMTKVTFTMISIGDAVNPIWIRLDTITAVQKDKDSDMWFIDTTIGARGTTFQPQAQFILEQFNLKTL
jgi:hypothetical protein